MLTGNGKGQVDYDLALAKAIPQKDNSVLGYFEYPWVELAVVLAAASLCCEQAPTVKAPAKTATIIIAFKNFNLYRPLS
jgi:hypothetical protein